VHLAIPADEPTLEGRLAVTHARTTAIKRTPEPVVAHAILNLIGRVPAFVQRIAIALFAMKGSLVATSVPGPSTRLTLAGSPLAGLRFWVPQAADVRVEVSVLSYAGEIGIGVATDADIESDPRALVDGFAAELADLGVTAPDAAPLRPRSRSNSSVGPYRPPTRC